MQSPTLYCLALCAACALATACNSSEPAGAPATPAPAPPAATQPPAPAPVPTGPAQITGFIFEDTNRNRILDASESKIAGVVNLTTPDGSQTIQSVTTSPEGHFQIAGAPPGDYRLFILMPHKFERTTDDSFRITVGADAPARAVEFGIVAQAAK